MLPVPDDCILLPDGRRLSYAEYGDPAGAPVFLFRGTPSSRLACHPDDTIATDLGARVIVTERPGFGRSDFQPGRTLLDWPADVVALADALGLDRFAIVGTSGGGPHAAACAYRIPQRLTLAAIVSGVGPIDAPGAVQGMHRNRRVGTAVGRYAPWLLRPMLWLVSNPRRDPARYLDRSSAGFPAADWAYINQPEMRAGIVANYAEAVRPGLHGFAHELRLFTRPWGFALADIEVEVYLWHGTEDASTPLPMAEYVANAIPNCRATFIPGEGHLLFYKHWREVLTVLVS
ncbi:MAG: alpha/beta hydrolase [Chloroflexi bacterium]|nr:alpha/beta hydrolase [Chloroflexota bacterium]MBU1751740.1 alpha/beta hydrolase [Chloroflexota bacterium]